MVWQGSKQGAWQHSTLGYEQYHPTPLQRSRATVYALPPVATLLQLLKLVKRLTGSHDVKSLRVVELWIEVRVAGAAWRKDRMGCCDSSCQLQEQILTSDDIKHKAEAVLAEHKAKPHELSYQQTRLSLQNTIPHLH